MKQQECLPSPLVFTIDWSPSQCNKTKKKFKIYTLEGNENECHSQNLWAAAKAVLRGKFMALNTDVRNNVKSQINKVTTSARKEGIRIRIEINEKTKWKSQTKS